MLQLISQAQNLGTLNTPSAYGNATAPVATTETIISTIIGFLTILAGVFFMIYFIMGAFRWVTSGGDSGAVSKARDQMLQGVLGLVVIVAAYGLIGVIANVLGLGNILNLRTQLQTLLPNVTVQ